MRPLLPCLLIVASTFYCVSAVRAQSVTFNVTGTIQPGTCDLSAADVTRTVPLDPIFKADLPASGIASSSTKFFSVTANNCAPGLTAATFTFTGTPDSNDPLRYQNTGTAKGVALELESASDSQTIGANGTNNVRTVAINGGQAVLNLAASYWRVNGVPVTTGSVTATATLNTTYN